MRAEISLSSIQSVKNSGWFGVMKVAFPSPHTAASFRCSLSGKSMVRMSETPRRPAKPFSMTARLTGVIARMSQFVGLGGTKTSSRLKRSP